MPSTARIPSVRNFLIADSVFQQAGGKWCVVGIFDKIVAGSFPVLHSTLGLYIDLADAEGDYETRIEFVNPEGQVLSRLAGIRISVPDPLVKVEFGIQTKSLPLLTPGKYRFLLFFNDVQAVSDISIEASLRGAEK